MPAFIGLGDAFKKAEDLQSRAMGELGLPAEALKKLLEVLEQRVGH